jgi:hypothetical protein
MSVPRLCSACRHQVLPVGPLQLAAGGIRSAAGTTTANDHLADELAERNIEDQRVKVGSEVFLSEPRFFPWCRKLTPSKQEVEAIRRAWTAGNDQLVQAYDRRIAIDYAKGIVMPIYVVCARANPRGECAAFERRRGGRP